MSTNETVLEVTNITQNSTKKNIRQSNFELLRIVSMFLIIAHHYVVHSNLANMDFGYNKAIAEFFIIGGKIGVNCFVLISAYFLLESKFKIKKLLKIILQTFFYSLLFSVLFSAFTNSNISMSTFAFPIIRSFYWFATVYVGLYVLSPFLNHIVHSFDRNGLAKLLIILTVLLTSFSNILNVTPFLSNIGWFIYLYFIAAYCRYYFNSKKFSNKTYLTMAILAYMSTYVLVILFLILGLKISFMDTYATYIIGMHTLPVLICSLALFLYFKDLNIKNSKIINLIASTTFGIYLIHDNRFFRYYLWHELYGIDTYLNAPVWQFILNSLAAIVFTFIICSIMELLRIYLIEKPLFKIKILDKYFKKIDNWMNI